MGAITDVPGIKVGEAQDEDALTGCTVVLCQDGAVAGVDVRGSAPGTRETDLLDPSNLVQRIHAIVLSGGSAFGLAAANGVMTYLRERGFGFKTANGIVPIVPGAVIYDLGIGSIERYPDHLMGYLACTVANNEVMEGNFGAGTGATVGKVLGYKYAMKAGTGTASAILKMANPQTGEELECTVGALVVTNAYGDIYKGDKIIAGAYDRETSTLLDTVKLLRGGEVKPTQPAFISNTTLAVVATDAPLTKAAARKMAQMTQDALGRTIRPAHTMFDGDTVFALSTSRKVVNTVDPFLLTCLGSLAAEVLVEAIHRSVLETQTAGGLPAARRTD